MLLSDVLHNNKIITGPSCDIIYYELLIVHISDLSLTHKYRDNCRHAPGKAICFFYQLGISNYLTINTYPYPDTSIYV